MTMFDDDQPIQQAEPTWCPVCKLELVGGRCPGCQPTRYRAEVVQQQATVPVRRPFTQSPTAAAGKALFVAFVTAWLVGLAVIVSVVWAVAWAVKWLLRKMPPRDRRQWPHISRAKEYLTDLITRDMDQPKE